MVYSLTSKSLPLRCLVVRAVEGTCTARQRKGKLLLVKE
jgi:hypothetical protein